MIREALEWLAFPRLGKAASSTRRGGYITEQIGLLARHRRHRVAWAHHLDQSRRAIAQAAEEMIRGHRCVVLGSGALFDVPLGALTQRFQEVVLVDIAHPWQAVRAAKQYDAVSLVTADVAGVAQAVSEISPEGSLPPAQPFCLGEMGLGESDLLVSVNLLSQLPIVPLGLARDRRLADEDTLERFGTAIVEAHLAGLRGHQGRIVLISDLERLVYDPGQENAEDDASGVGRVSAIFEAEVPMPDRSWWWNIAPKGELDRRYSVANKVGAWLDF